MGDIRQEKRGETRARRRKMGDEIQGAGNKRLVKNTVVVCGHSWESLLLKVTSVKG